MSTNHAAKFKKYGARHYGFNKKEIVVKTAKGIVVLDTKGNRYLDIVSGYASNGFGHAYKPLHAAMIDALVLDEEGWGIPGTIPNAIPTVAQTDFLEQICSRFGYEKALPMNSGAEAVETGLKLARKWAYTRKGIERNTALIVVCKGNFHGRPITEISFSSEELYKKDFGPHTPGFIEVPFGDSDMLEQAFKEHTNIAAFLFEPIQGESGVNIPPKGYLKKVRKLCTQYNVLMIADEVQTGLGRTGKLLACDHEGVRPDIVLLAKLLGGGKIPVSCVLADEQHMVFEPGEHGSTYAGNAFGMTVASKVLDLIVKKRLCENASQKGAYLLAELTSALLPRFKEYIKEIRGQGLLIGIELSSRVQSADIIDKFFDVGLLAKDAHGVIRISPALIITKTECKKIVRLITKAFSLI